VLILELEKGNTQMK